ncbi:MAG: protein kinase [Candidatus Polarisedimenticolia bacterium]
MELAAGTRILGYDVERKLGEGGMATVYKAVHPQFGQVVAIKVLDPLLARNPELRARFAQEARVQMELRHPGIVQVLTGDVSEESAALVMEWVEGLALDQVIARRGALPADETARIFEQVLDAVGFAHGRGVVHRDLKPGNILVEPNGVAKVSDFGIARVVGDLRLTRTGTTMGSPHYMAPEQVVGLKEIDARADIYALGATLFETLTGRPPFADVLPPGAEGDFALREAHVRTAPPDPRTLVPSLPPALAEVALIALRKNPDERFQSCAAFKAALLDAARDAAPTPAFAAGAAGSAPRAAVVAPPAVVDLLSATERPTLPASPWPAAPRAAGGADRAAPNQRPNVPPIARSIASSNARPNVPPCAPPSASSNAQPNVPPNAQPNGPPNAQPDVPPHAAFSPAPPAGLSPALPAVAAPPPARDVSPRRGPSGFTIAVLVILFGVFGAVVGLSLLRSGTRTVAAPSPAPVELPTPPPEQPQPARQPQAPPASPAESASPSDEAAPDEPAASSSDSAPASSAAAPAETAAAPDLDEVAAMWNRFVHDVSVHDLDDISACYGANVDWRDQGVKPHDYIVNGHRDYWKRWPEIAYQRIGAFDAERGPRPGTISVTFPIHFAVRNAERGERIEGEARHHWTLGYENGRVVIVAEDQTDFTRRRTQE